MALRLVLMLWVALFVFSNAADAANWVYLQRQEGTRYGQCSEYVDADSVVRYYDRMTYWKLWVFDIEEQHGIGSILFKQEVVFGKPDKFRTVEWTHFDRAGGEMRSWLSNSDYFDSHSEEALRALDYAKTYTGTEPPRPDVTVPKARWYGAVTMDDREIHWDIRSIGAWPKKDPKEVDIVVRWVWNEKGLEARKAYLMETRPHKLGYDPLVSTQVNYRFRLADRKMQIISVADLEASGDRISYFDDGYGKWQDIPRGSVHEKALEIARHWLKGTE